MRLDRIILDNFLTYDHLDYNIPKVPMQIQGRNLTEEDQESNGSGKSGILTAIEYCIAASNSRDVLDKELVTFGYDESKIQLYASCDVRKEIIHITWVIKIKGSNKLSIKKKNYGGEFEPVSFSNSSDGKKWISSWFAISKDDLFNYYIVNKSRFKSFFKSSQTDKMALISRFSDSSIVDGIDVIDTDDLQSEYNEASSDKSKLEGKLESNEEREIAEKNRDLKLEHTEKVSKLNEEIGYVENEIDDIEEDIEKLYLSKTNLDQEEVDLIKDKEMLSESKRPIKLELDSYKPKFEKLDLDLKEAKILVNDFKSTDFNSLRKNHKEKITAKKELIETEKSNKNKAEENETKVLGLLQSISVKLEGSIECPRCEHEFILDGDIEELKVKQSKAKIVKDKIKLSISSIEETIKSINSSIEKIDKKISKINTKEQEENSNKNTLTVALNKIVTNINALKDEYNKVEAKIIKIDSEISECDGDLKDITSERIDIDSKVKNKEEKIVNLKTKISNKKDQIKSLKIGDNKDILKEIADERVKLDRKLAIKNKELLDIETKISEKNEWSNNFKQFKMHIANRSLEVIEYHCNRYLKGMGSDLRIKLEGYKILSSGKIKDEITTKILRGTERSYSSFSGGEQGRLLFASILANRHMLNSTHPYGGLDFLSVDEVFEGIDSLGLKSLIHSAKTLDVSVLIVTHVTDENVSDDVLMIEKINGISKIKN